MARLYSINEICERALRKIGAYSINDSGADAAYMEEARHWLDMIVAHLSARKRRWWLVPATYSFDLTAGQAAYNLRTSLSGAKLEFIVQVNAVEVTGGTAQEVPIMRRQEWERDRLRKDGGPPWSCWIDRTDDPTLTLAPTPVAPIAHRIEVVAQAFPTDLRTLQGVAKLPEVPQVWNLAMVHRLAAELGNGPVRKQPQDEVRDMQETAAELIAQLDAYADHEQADEPRRVAYHDF